MFNSKQATLPATLPVIVALDERPPWSLRIPQLPATWNRIMTPHSIVRLANLLAL